MQIGIPIETKTLEGRVGLIPTACELLIRDGHQLLVEHNAGLLSGYNDDSYRRIGATLVNRETLFGDAQLIIKVKEPQPDELALLKPDHLLFCFLHLAALPELQQSLLDSGCTAIGFETLATEGQLPILAPMSEIAGRLAVQYGTSLLHHPAGGPGIMLGGIGGAERGKVLILGAGNAGGSAASLAAQIGAQVTIMDINGSRLREFHRRAANINSEYPYPESILNHLQTTDLLIGAVLIPGKKAPKIISSEMIKAMRPGSVFIDIAVDQGGCSETTRPTSYASPTFQHAGITHFCVNNMPGAVPRTASQALSSTIIPFARELATDSWRNNPVLTDAINLEQGQVKLPALLN